MPTILSMPAARASHETPPTFAGDQRLVPHHQTLHFFEGELRGRYLSVEGRRASAGSDWLASELCERPPVANGLPIDYELLRRIGWTELTGVTYHVDYHQSSEGARQPHGLSWSHLESGSAGGRIRLPCSVSCSGDGLEIETCGATAGC